MNAFKTLCEQATKRPWRIEDPMGDIELSIIKDDHTAAQSWTFVAAVMKSDVGETQMKANAALLALAANHVAELVAAVLHLRHCSTFICDERKAIELLLTKIEDEAAGDHN